MGENVVWSVQTVKVGGIRQINEGIEFASQNLWKTKHLHSIYMLVDGGVKEREERGHLWPRALIAQRGSGVISISLLISCFHLFHLSPFAPCQELGGQR